MKLSQIRKNPNNPRIIRDEKFEKLKRSIQDFPQMMELRPIIVDEAGVILGGNMRYEAIKSLKMSEFPDEWVKRVEELTDDQKKEFIVKDNVGFGDWDWDAIANEWDDLPLDDWGLEGIPVAGDSGENITKLNLNGYNQVHVLLSFHPDVFSQIQDQLDRLRRVDGVEYEQSAN